MKLKKWILLLGFDSDECYYFNSTKWDVSDDELQLCINEQVYGGLFK